MKVIKTVKSNNFKATKYSVLFKNNFVLDIISKFYTEQLKVFSRCSTAKVSKQPLFFEQVNKA